MSDLALTEDNVWPLELTAWCFGNRMALINDPKPVYDQYGNL